MTGRPAPQREIGASRLGSSAVLLFFLLFLFFFLFFFFFFLFLSFFLFFFFLSFLFLSSSFSLFFFFFFFFFSFLSPPSSFFSFAFRVMSSFSFFSFLLLFFFFLCALFSCCERVLTAEAISFVVGARAQIRCRSGRPPGAPRRVSSTGSMRVEARFPAETKAIRDGDWRVAPIPRDLSTAASRSPGPSTARW